MIVSLQYLQLASDTEVQSALLSCGFQCSDSCACFVLLVFEQCIMPCTSRSWLVGQYTWLETASQSELERGALSTLRSGGTDSSSAQGTCHVHAASLVMETGMSIATFHSPHELLHGDLRTSRLHQSLSGEQVHCCWLDLQSLL